ncbi:MAG: PepSY domain-containing protein [Bdellovibrionales bacterium]|nr:PepSY domain-containing protein [Bdellovibrionales bacterium]
MRLRVLVRKIHKWLALIIGIQVLLWTATGLFMSFVPIEKIRSEHLVKKNKPVLLNQRESFISIKEILSQNNESPIKISLRSLIDKYVYEVQFSEKMELYDALTGDRITPINKDMASRIAVSHFLGDAQIKGAELIEDAPIEYRGKLPVWRIDFANSENSTFYVSPETGQLLSRRGTLWRIYDFMWMLHIMDYQERENFNHWWLVLAALLAVSMSASGIWLIFYSFRKREFKFPIKR